MYANHITERVIEVAHHTIKTGATVRDSAKVFGVSKSTIHKDLTKRLPQINSNLAMSVNKILKINLDERHIRGGEATRRKFTLLDKNN